MQRLKNIKKTMVYAMACILAFGMLGNTLGVHTVYAEEETTDLEVVPDEVIALTDTLEEAEEIARYYDIELKSYEYGVAVFTEPIIDTSVAQLRMAVSMPTLYPNVVFTLPEMEFTPLGGDVADTSGVATVSNNADTYYQYHLNENHISEAWEVTKGIIDYDTADTSDDKKVRVAIIDTGIDTDHVAFPNGTLDATLCYNAYYDDTGTYATDDQKNATEGQKYGLTAVEDDFGHGTHVAGIIAGNDSTYDRGTNYISGMYGIAPDAQLIIIKADDPNGHGLPTDAIARGINFAIEKEADIINMSLGIAYDDYVGTARNSSDDLLGLAIADAVEAGIVVVCAAGNDLDDNAGYPAAYDTTIAVSATNSGFAFDSTNSKSNHGSQIDVAAQGGIVYSAKWSDLTIDGEVIAGNYVGMSGTSMAAPIVSGVAALILAANPTYTAAEVQQVLEATAMEAGDLGKDVYYGNGIVNAYSAVLGTDALHKVTYDYNDNSGDTSTTYVAPNDLLIAPNDLADKTGNPFLGWTTTQNGTTGYDFSSEVTGNMTLYAKWETDLTALGEYTLGDVNEDGKITLLDALQVMQYVSGTIQFTAEQRMAANVAGSSTDSITLLDALTIMQYVANTITSFD